MLIYLLLSLTSSFADPSKDISKDAIEAKQWVQLNCKPSSFFRTCYIIKEENCVAHAKPILEKCKADSRNDDEVIKCSNRAMANRLDRSYVLTGDGSCIGMMKKMRR